MNTAPSSPKTIPPEPQPPAPASRAGLIVFLALLPFCAGVLILPRAAFAAEGWLKLPVWGRLLLAGVFFVPCLFGLVHWLASMIQRKRAQRAYYLALFEWYCRCEEVDKPAPFRGMNASGNQRG
ncbi:MAG: hypothetical protein JW750_08870 [Anaerolineaceae bacterium]|nr:hypothetical protein [Anaerolineaceae bacterium]